MEHQSSRGSCFCGAVQFSVALLSKWVGHCHCTRCQRAHGAPFSLGRGSKPLRSQSTTRKPYCVGMSQVKADREASAVLGAARCSSKPSVGQGNCILPGRCFLSLFIVSPSYTATMRRTWNVSRYQIAFPRCPARHEHTEAQQPEPQPRSEPEQLFDRPHSEARVR